jgi:predicted Rossmann fold nucleotide-binding protein DprA/Smf involved in DNA uptake
VEDVEDILDEFSFLVPRDGAKRVGADSCPEVEPGPLPELTPEEQAVVNALGEEERLDIDSLTRLCGLKPASVSSALIGLEMKRIVRMQPGRIVELRR